MTTATLASGNRTMDTAVVRPRRSLEELVDQLIAAMFKAEEPATSQAGTPAATAPQSVVRSVHEARRLRQSGDVDGALTVLGGVDTAQATPREARWAFSEWKQLVKRRFGDRDALVYSQSAGRAAAVAPQGDGGMLEVVAVLGMRWKPGKVVSGRSLRGLRPVTRRCVMVTANVDISGAEGPSLPGRYGGSRFGVRLRGRGRVPPGRVPLPRRGGGQLHGLRRLGAVLLLRLRRGRRRAGLRAAGTDGPDAAGGDRAAGRGPQALRFRGRQPSSRNAAAEVRRAASTRPRAPDGGGALLRRSGSGVLQKRRGYLASRGVGPVAAARLGLGYCAGRRAAAGPRVLRLLREAHPGLRAVHGAGRGAVRRHGRRPRRLRRPRPLARGPGPGAGP